MTHQETTDQQAITQDDAEGKEVDVKSDTKGISMSVTGFGPFQDIPINPSTILVTELPDYLKSSSSEPWKQELASLVTEWIVMETSVQDVCKTLDAMKALGQQGDDDDNNQKTRPKKVPDLLLHLGVHYKAEGFHIEQCAYNDASFRIPDECGYQPKDQAIVNSQQLGDSIETQLHVQDLVDYQTKQFPSVKTKLSTDPGRFVCNYTYCYSMHHVQQPCLFLHIPKFEVVPKEVQLEYVACLMKRMVEQITANETMSREISS